MCSLWDWDLKHKSLILKISVLIASLIVTLSFYFLSLHLRQRSFLRYKEKQWVILGKEVDEVLKKFKGKAGIVIVDLQNGWTITRNQNEKYPAASVIKLPIAVVVYKAIAEGRVSRRQVIEIRRPDVVPGSGVIRKRNFPQRYTLDDLAALMLTVSDNTACNKIISLLGFDYINTEMKKLGLQDTTLRRFMMDFKARDRGFENFTSARDIAEVWKLLYYEKILGEKESRYLIELLKNQKVNDRISRLLATRTIVANKTGLERNACHDSGIIFTPYGDILIVVLTSDFKSFKLAKEFIATLAFLGYNYLLQSGYEPQRFIQHSYSPVSS